MKEKVAADAREETEKTQHAASSRNVRTARESATKGE